MKTSGARLGRDKNSVKHNGFGRDLANTATSVYPITVRLKWNGIEKLFYWPFLHYRRIIRLDELGQTSVVRLVMRL